MISFRVAIRGIIALWRANRPDGTDVSLRAVPDPLAQARRLNSLSVYFADTMRRAAGGHSIERRHLAIDRLDDALHFLLARRNGIEGFACFLHRLEIEHRADGNVLAVVDAALHGVERPARAFERENHVRRIRNREHRLRAELRHRAVAEDDARAKVVARGDYDGLRELVRAQRRAGRDGNN